MTKDEGIQKLKSQVLQTLTERSLADSTNPVVLMVSGGSDSTALAYFVHDLQAEGLLGQAAILHVNHQLRGQESDDDARFVESLADLLSLPFYLCEVDIETKAKQAGSNIEAMGRQERYLAAQETMRSLCRQAMTPISEGRIFTAHTLDDRIETFYMRSIVGTGPGGFRSMKYLNGSVARPFLDVFRRDLRTFLHERKESGLPMAHDDAGNLWREDATNAHTDRFRSYVRHNIVPLTTQWDSSASLSLRRAMNLIADEDDMVNELADDLEDRKVRWIVEGLSYDPDPTEGFLLDPDFGEEHIALQRRVVHKLLARMLKNESRIDAASVNAVLEAFEEVDGQVRPKSGYVKNIQGDVAVSSNKNGVRIEPMSSFRARRKRMDKGQDSPQD